MFNLLSHYGIRFEEQAHAYWKGTDRRDSVTSVLPYFGNDFLDKNPAVINLAGKRGSSIANDISAIERVDVTPNNDPQWCLHLDAYRQFKRDTGFDSIASELFVYHPTMGYAGRIDIAGFMPLTKMAGPGLVEVKASYEIPATVGWQSAAYLEAFNKNAALYGLPKLKWRACLHLNPKLYKNGYRLEPLTDPSDFGSFACLLGAHRLARRLNLALKFEPIDATKPATAPNPSEVFA